MCPEALENENYDCKKFDVWSCGVILYEMLYGKHPWTGKTVP